MLSSSLVPISGVDLRQLLTDVAAVALHQASRDDQLLGAANPFVFRHFEDRVDGFFLGRVDETAGIYDQNFGLIGMWRQLVAAGHQLPHHHFTVHKVFGTTQTDKTDFQMFPPDVPSGFFSGYQTGTYIDP